MNGSPPPVYEYINVGIFKRKTGAQDSYVECYTKLEHFVYVSFHTLLDNSLWYPIICPRALIDSNVLGK